MIRPDRIRAARRLGGAAADAGSVPLSTERQDRPRATASGSGVAPFLAHVAASSCGCGQRSRSRAARPRRTVQWRPPAPPWRSPRPCRRITELTRIEPIHLQRLAHQGVFTTGLLLEVSETAARRQTLADQVVATTNDVLAWRDEALMLNLAGFRAAEHDLFRYAGFDGLRSLLGRRPRHVPGARWPAPPGSSRSSRRATS